MSLEGQITAETTADTPLETTDAVATAERDFEAEARSHGWTPKEDFKGDPGRWIDAETFVKRADEVMPLLKKQNKALKSDLDELRRTLKQATKFFSESEERAYKRALADIEAKHTEAVETGDVAAANAAIKEMRDLKKPEMPVDKPVVDPAEAQRSFAAWAEQSDWYMVDDAKTNYANLQAETMGPATEWPEGPDAWLTEIDKRVARKFEARKPSPTNNGGNRPQAKTGGRSYSDLPAAAKAQCDRFVKSGACTREDYVKSFDFAGWKD